MMNTQRVNEQSPDTNKDQSFLSLHLRLCADKLWAGGILSRDELLSWCKKIEESDTRGLMQIKQELEQLDPDKARERIMSWEGKFFLDDPADSRRILEQTDTLSNLREAKSMPPDIGDNLFIGRWD